MFTGDAADYSGELEITNTGNTDLFSTTGLTNN